MIRWYCGCALTWLPRISLWAQRIAMQQAALVSGIWGARWGALIKHGHLNVHWAAMQLPVFLLDYVIVHALAHSAQSRHTRAVWAASNAPCPTTSAA